MAHSMVVVNKAGAAPAPSHEDVSAMLTSVFSAKTSHASVDAAYGLCTVLQNSVGFRGLQGYGILDEIKKAATDKKNAVRREGAMNALGALFERFPRAQRLGEVVFLVQDEGLVPAALDALADKAAPVKESARYALDALFENLSAEAKVFGLLPILVKYLGKKSGKWQGAAGAFELMGRMADKAKMGMESLEVEQEKDVLREAMGKRLERLIPVVEGGMHDLKSEVCLSFGIFRHSANRIPGCKASREDDEQPDYAVAERRHRAPDPTPRQSHRRPLHPKSAKSYSCPITDHIRGHCHFARPRHGHAPP
jgi:elongation factor 3